MTAWLRLPCRRRTGQVSRVKTPSGHCGYDFFQSSSSIEFETEDIFASGDRCLVQWTFRWVGQDNEPGRVRGVDLFKVKDGKVAEKLVYVKG